MDTMNILGISFSTRILGLSVMSNSRLIEYSVKLYKDKWTPEKCLLLQRTLVTCLADYNISDIILSIPPHHYKNDGWDAIYECVQSIAKEKSIPIFEYSYKVFPTLCIEGEKPTKYGFMRSMIYYYDELYPYYLKERRNKKQYYMKLFEAVGVSLCFRKQLIQGNRG